MIQFAFLGFFVYTCLVIVEIDKRLKFHKILGLEYMLKVQKYSNTEYLIKSWIMITTGIISFIVVFSHNLYIFINPNSNVIYLPAWLRILTYFLWQSAPPLLVFRSIQTFAFKRIRIAINDNFVDFKKQITQNFIAWKSYVLQVTKCSDNCIVNTNQITQIAMMFWFSRNLAKGM